MNENGEAAAERDVKKDLKDDVWHDNCQRQRAACPGIIFLFLKKKTTNTNPSFVLLVAFLVTTDKKHAHGPRVNSRQSVGTRCTH